MANGVDTPSSVENEAVSEATHQEVVEKATTNSVFHNKSGKNEAHEGGDLEVVFLLESNNGIVKKILDVQLLSFFNEFRRLLDKEPANVSKEETLVH